MKSTVKEGTKQKKAGHQAQSNAVDHAFYLEHYLKSYKAVLVYLEDFAMISMTIIAFITMALIFESIFWLLLNALDVIPWLIRLWYKNIYLLQKKEEIRQDLEAHPIWRVNWNMRDGYKDEATIQGLKMFMNREMAKCFDVLGVDEIIVPRADAERLLKKDGIDPEHELDPVLFAEYLDKHYDKKGMPRIIDGDHGVVEIEYEHVIEHRPIGKFITQYKKNGVILDLATDYFDPNDPIVEKAQVPICKDIETDELTGGYWKKINGVYLDPDKAEEWTAEEPSALAGENAMHVYRVRLGMHLVFRAKQPNPQLKLEKTDVTEFFMQMLGTKERNIKYQDGLVPRNGLSFKTSQFADMDIRIDRISARGFVLCTNTKNWGTSNLALPIIAKGSHTVEDSLVQVLEAALIDEEVMAINKEKRYDEIEHGLKDQDETKAHDAFVDLGNTDTTGTIKKIESEWLPKDKEIRIAWWRTTVLLSIFSAVGGMGLLSLILFLARVIF